MPSHMLTVVLSVSAVLACRCGASEANDLLVAAERGDAAAVDRFLHDRPGLLNAVDFAGQTALHAAIARKHVSVVESLLKHGADYRIKDVLGRTAVTLAAQSGSEELATRFLLNVPDVDLPKAVQEGDADTVRLVLLGDPSQVWGRPHYDTDNAYWTLRAAVEHRRFEILKLLTAGLPEADRPDGLRDAVTSRLCSAAWKGEADLLREYIQAGNDINVVDDFWFGTPLHQAACAGNVELVRTLLAAGAKVNLAANGWTALHAAATYGHREVAETLLAAGAEIDATQPWGWRPIHNALWKGHLDMVRLLEQRGAKIDAWLAAGLGRTAVALRLIGQLPPEPPVEGPPPVFWAARCGHLDTLKALWTDDSLARVELDHKFHRLEGQSLLHVAAEAGQTDVMRWLIAHGAPVDAAGGTATEDYLSEMTPLHMAAAAGQIEAATLLLAAGAKLEGTTEESTPGGGPTYSAYTPLLVAVTEGKKEMVEFLLDRGADIEAASTPQATALSNAAAHGRKDLCELLLARGAKLNGKPGASPLLAAAGYPGQPEIVELLLQRGADVNLGADDGQSVLLAALNVRPSEWDAPRRRILDLLLARNPSLKSIAPRQGLEPSLLAAAVKARNTALVRSALDLGMLAQEKDLDRLLIEAGCCGNVEMMKLLLAAGLMFHSSPESQRSQDGMRTVFDGAVQSGHKDMVRFLIGQGWDPNATADRNEETPLIRAVRAGHKLATIVLLGAGAKPDVSGRYGSERALDIAAEKGRADLVRVLLVHGATLNFNPNGPKGSLTIHRAAYGGHTAALELLLDFDAGRTPGAAAQALHTAVSRGHTQMVRRLAARDIDINIRDEQGRTPLHTAIPASANSAAVLLELGADPNIRDKEGMTPLQLAVLHGWVEFAEKPLAKGAKLDIFSAAGLGRIEAAAAALAADPSLLKKTRWQGPPLVWAAAGGRTEMVKWLLDRGADVNAGRDPKNYRSFSPLLGAVRRGERALVELLFDRGADPNAPGEDALQVAVGAGRTEIVQLLLERKAATNRPAGPSNNEDPFAGVYRSPLHLAAGLGYVQIAALLIERGADIELADHEKRTPLDVAAWEQSGGASSYSYSRAPKDLPPCRRDLVVTLLIDAYQKQHKKPPQQALDNALGWAAGQGAFDAVSRLLDAGANVNARGQYGRTPFVEAVYQFHNRSYDNRSAQAEKRKQHVAIIKLLMARGADPNLGDRNGGAMWYAQEYRRDKEFVELLSRPEKPAQPGPK